MRKITRFVLKFLVPLIVVFSIGACQDEFEELGSDSNEESETINANSSTAALITKASSNDGSFDNIVDETSCFAVNFPYTVEANGVELTIGSIEDLHAIEEIFDEIEIDEDLLEIIFPITITLADYSEIEINSEEELFELAEDCIEGGADDDIECIDFVYPFDIFTFDVTIQNTGSITVDNDRDLRRFFAGLNEDDVVSIDFPIDLIKADGTQITVNDIRELVEAIEAAKDACDEDDDNDYNDDDFDEEDVVEYLTDCIWELRDIRRDGLAQTDQYLEYLFEFLEDGTVEVYGRFGFSLTGIWETTFTEDGVLLTMDFDGGEDLSAEWLVHEIEDGKIKLFTNNDNRIILRENCEIEEPGDPLSLVVIRETLKMCDWEVVSLVQENEALNFNQNPSIDFKEDGQVIFDDVTIHEGTWEVSYDLNQKPTLLLYFESAQYLNFQWPLYDFRTDRIKFYDQALNSELILEKDCENNIPSECDANTIVNGDLFETAPDDQVFINSVEIDGNCLHIEYSASGCDGSSWEVALIDQGIIMESFPPQRNLRLSLNNQEACDAVITKEMSFDISNLQVEGEKVYLNITNYQESVLYEY